MNPPASLSLHCPGCDTTTPSKTWPGAARTATASWNCPASPLPSRLGRPDPPPPDPLALRRSPADRRTRRHHPRRGHDPAGQRAGTAGRAAQSRLPDAHRLVQRPRRRPAGGAGPPPGGRPHDRRQQRQRRHGRRRVRRPRRHRLARSTSRRPPRPARSPNYAPTVPPSTRSPAPARTPPTPRPRRRTLPTPFMPATSTTLSSSTAPRPTSSNSGNSSADACPPRSSSPWQRHAGSRRLPRKPRTSRRGAYRSLASHRRCAGRSPAPPWPQLSEPARTSPRRSSRRRPSRRASRSPVRHAGRRSSRLSGTPVDSSQPLPMNTFARRTLLSLRPGCMSNRLAPRAGLPSAPVSSARPTFHRVLMTCLSRWLRSVAVV